MFCLAQASSVISSRKRCAQFWGLFLVLLSFSCKQSNTQKQRDLSQFGNNTSQLKVTGDCVDPDLSKVLKGVSLTLCDGSVGEGLFVPEKSNCTNENQIDCVTTDQFPSFELKKLSADILKDKVQFAGVTGTVQARPVDCTKNGETTCVTNNAFQAANLSTLSASVVKKGVIVGDVTGTFPSATAPLGLNTGGVRSLTSEVFIARLQAEETFEYWDPTGTRQTGKGDNDLRSINIRQGTDIFGVVGSLKSNCRNAVNDSLFNYSGIYDGSPAPSPGDAFDVWDTIDDYGNGAFPVSMRGGTRDAWSLQNYCDGTQIDDKSDSVFTDPAGVASSFYSGNVNWTKVFYDNFTGLYLSNTLSTNTTRWESALSLCHSMDILGKGTGWRLPTQKELMSLYVGGLYNKKESFKVSGADVLHTLYAWSASSDSTNTGNAWTVKLSTGEVKVSAKANSASTQVICVRQ
ncbi:MAG: DUF1566 domain-containing protein [Oligoflexales bacterium]|nr:DUF1566 domain-containing protein [Oligoflexales bacterium]